MRVSFRARSVPFRSVPQEAADFVLQKSAEFTKQAETLAKAGQHPWFPPADADAAATAAAASAGAGAGASPSSAAAATCASSSSSSASDGSGASAPASTSSEGKSESKSDSQPQSQAQLQSQPQPPHSSLSVDDQRIVNWVMVQTAKALVDESTRRQSTDNITVIVVRI